MDILKSYASAMDRQIDRKRFFAEQEARDNAGYERVMDHVREIITSGRMSKIKTIRDVSMNDTERALDETGSDMSEARERVWNV